MRGWRLTGRDGEVMRGGWLEGAGGGEEGVIYGEGEGRVSSREMWI